MTEEITVRNYRPADYPEICRIDAPMFSGMGGHVLFRHIEELFGPLFFVAEKNGEIIGYVLGGIHLDNPKTGKLIRIGVSSDHQRQDCGTRLTTALFTRMRELGVENVHLTVAEDNTAARNFYTKIGFTIAEERENYFYPDVFRLVLTKKLVE